MKNFLFMDKVWKEHVLFGDWFSLMRSTLVCAIVFKMFDDTR